MPVTSQLFFSKNSALILELIIYFADSCLLELENALLVCQAATLIKTLCINTTNSATLIILTKIGKDKSFELFCCSASENP